MSGLDPITIASFLDELEKIAVAHGRTSVPKGRAGKRSMRAETLLRKEKDGTLFKHSDAAGSPQPVRGDSGDDPDAALPPKRAGDVPSKDRGNIPTTEKTGEPIRGDVGPMTSGESLYGGAETRKSKRKGEVPTQNNFDVQDRFDGRGEATTVQGPGVVQNSVNSGVNNPTEHA